MSRIIRPLQLAMLCAGLTLSAAICQGAESYAGDSAAPAPPTIRDPNVQLVSATVCTPPDDSAAQPNNAQAGAADYSAQQTDPANQPKKPVQKKRTTTFNGTPDGTNVRQVSNNAAMPQADENGQFPVQQTAHYTVGVVVPQESAQKPSQPATPGSSGEDLMGGDACGCDAGQCCNNNCCGGWCIGADYLYLRPHFSNGLAFHEVTATTTPEESVQTDQAVNFDPIYQSDFRVFAGYHTACGDEFRFSYWHIQSNASATGTASGDFASGSGTEILAPGLTALATDGESITTSTKLHLDMYDFDLLRAADCSDECDCCPQWYIHWLFGVRIADYQRTLDSTSDLPETFGQKTTFVGAGPRLGVEARREIGHTKFSLFFSGDAALLLGHFTDSSNLFTPGEIQNTVDQSSNATTRVVPNFELAGGITYQPFCHTSITAGWMLESFTDIGGGEGEGSMCANCGSFSTALTAGNITTFEGAFVRLEHCF